MPDPHFVVFHLPGPTWQAGVPSMSQAGIHLHAAHYRTWQADGRLLMGGPFLDAAGGGMMIARLGVTEEELHSFAAADPTVASGLLQFSLRPWYVAMR